MSLILDLSIMLFNDFTCRGKLFMVSPPTSFESWLGGDKQLGEEEKEEKKKTHTVSKASSISAVINFKNHWYS